MARRIRSARARQAGGDGAKALIHIAESATRVAPTEVWESRNPWLVERVELIRTRAAPAATAAGSGSAIASARWPRCG